MVTTEIKSGLNTIHDKRKYANKSMAYLIQFLCLWLEAVHVKRYFTVLVLQLLHSKKKKEKPTKSNLSVYLYMSMSVYCRHLRQCVLCKQPPIQRQLANPRRNPCALFSIQIYSIFCIINKQTHQSSDQGDLWDKICLVWSHHIKKCSFISDVYQLHWCYTDAFRKKQNKCKLWIWWCAR